MKLKTDKLAVKVYANHGDTCGLAPHCESLGCASGHKSSDYVLVASFAYLTEGLDYCAELCKRKVHSRLVSRIVPNSPYITDYPKQEFVA
jgi:hypothetical protein